jgi:hypothetical protein
MLQNNLNNISQFAVQQQQQQQQHSLLSQASLAYPNLLGTKGYVVVVVLQTE